MTIEQSITVSADPGEITINGEMPAGATRPSFVLSSLELPSFAYRIGYAQDADDIDGKVLLSRALEAGTLPLVIKVHGSDIAELQTNRRFLETLFSQIPYTITVTLGGEDEVYPAFPAFPQWAIDIPNRIATATLSVPVNPMGA